MSVWEVTNGPCSTCAAKPIYHKAEKIYNKAYQVFINIYGAYSISQDVLYLPPLIHKACKAAGYIGVIDVAFAGPRLIANITELVGSYTTWDRVYALALAVVEACNIASLAAEIVQACKDLGFFAQKTLLWTEHFNYAFLPNQIVMLKESIEQSVATLRIRQNVSITYVRDNAQDVQSTLFLSKKCHLKQRIEHYIDTNHNGEPEQFMQTLKTRINTCCSLAIIDTISTLASTILSFATLWYETTPLLVAIYTATTIASIALAIMNYAILPKNPFE